MIREIPRGVCVYSYFLGGERGGTGQNGGGKDCSPSQEKVEGCKVEVLLEYCGVSRGDESKGMKFCSWLERFSVGMCSRGGKFGGKEVDSTFLRSFVSVGKREKISASWYNNFARNRWLFQGNEVNLLLFHLVVTMRMFIFYAIGIHERASEYDSQPAYYFEKNFKYRKSLRSIFREKFI